MGPSGTIDTGHEHRGCQLLNAGDLPSKCSSVYFPRARSDMVALHTIIPGLLTRNAAGKSPYY